MHPRHLLTIALTLLFFGSTPNALSSCPPDTLVDLPGSRVAPESVLLLGSHFSLSTSEKLFAGEFGLLLRSRPGSNFMLGLNGEVGIKGWFENAKSNSEYNILMYALGPKFAWRTGKRFFFTVDPALVLGAHERHYTTSTSQFFPTPKTTISTHTDEEKIKGFQLGLSGVWMFPVNRQGFYLTAGGFFRTEASSLFASCVGLRAGFGFRL